jgi:protein PhnA
MNLLAILKQRADDQCELCGSKEDLHVYQVEPAEKAISECQMLGCGKCLSSLDNPINDVTDANHWRCLAQSMWSEYISVQVVVWRVLEQLKSQGWAAELQSQMYFDDVTLDWARSGLNIPATTATEDNANTLDSVGNSLETGDTVTLIKDLDVKGGGFTAKRGTVVKKISLTDNPEHVEGQRIVLVAKFLKKSM